jgi:hypothetical protein
MDTYYDKLLIKVFAITCAIPIPEDSKLTFSQFYATHYATIFKFFHIENPNQQEVDLIHDVLIGTKNDYTNIKHIVYQMSQNEQYKFEDIENFTFQAVCPIIVEASRKYRQLEQYRKQEGIVVVPVTNLVIPHDLRGFQAKYIIVPVTGGFEVYDSSLQLLGFFGSQYEANDYCENREYMLKMAKFGGCLFGAGIVGYLLVKW